MADNDNPMLLKYQKSPEEGHSYPEVASQPDHTEPTWTQKEINPLYESLPGAEKDPSVAVRAAKRTSPAGAPATKQRLEGKNNIYGEVGQQEPSGKKRYKDRGPVPKPQHGRRRASGVVACGAAVLFVGLALVLSIAALVLFVFLFLGILPLPSSNQEIESLRVNVSALQQRVMELQSPSSDPTMAPVEVAQFADIRVVNYSECQSVRRHCNISDSTASCAVNIPMPPEFLNTSISESTRVVVEQSCWFSDITGEVSDLQTALEFRSLPVMGVVNPIFTCNCAGTVSRAVGSESRAACYFYIKECALTNVRVQQT